LTGTGDYLRGAVFKAWLIISSPVTEAAALGDERRNFFSFFLPWGGKK